VIVGKDVDAKKISARNVLQGTVAKVQEGAVNNEVALRLSGGGDLTAIITKESSHSLGLKEGDAVFAIFKANNVIVAVD
jgi:molybdate transport system regulatory protein